MLNLHLILTTHYLKLYHNFFINATFFIQYAQITLKNTIFFCFFIHFQNYKSVTLMKIYIRYKIIL